MLDDLQDGKIYEKALNFIPVNSKNKDEMLLQGTGMYPNSYEF